MSIALPIRSARPKITMSSVQGKVVVMNSGGQRVSQWGGTECFLSRQTGLGPCLVVRSSRHKKHQGTFFRLEGLQQVLSSHVAQGKLTVVLPHAQHTCSVFIDTTSDIDELKMMAGVLQDRSSWARSIEKNVASRTASARGRRSLSDTQQGQLRDPSVTELERGDANDDEWSNEDEWEYVTKGQQAAAAAAAAGAAEQSSALPEQPVVKAEGHSLAPPPGKTISPSARWTSEQRLALSHLKAGANVFVSGAAGTGKTEWLQHVVAALQQASGGGHSLSTAVTAVTGVAARGIGGITVYSFAGIGRGEGSLESILQRVHSRPDVVRSWRQCSTLIIDEIGMLPARILTLLDNVARDVRNKPAEPFGGLQVLVVGDFLQLPPVSKGGEDVQLAFASPSWRQARFRSVEFTTNHRHKDDATFAHCCNCVRRGQYTLAVDDVIQSCIDRPLDERYGVQATTILSRRKDVEAHNQMQLQALEELEFFRYHSEDYAAIPGADLDNEVSLPSLLTLKRGAQVVLLASLPDYPHLCNGELGLVSSFVDQSHGPALPMVQFSTGEAVMVSPVTVEVMGRDGRLSLSRRQVPLQLAWAMTVHRVQGMTLPMARVRLDRSFFECGQAYVAVSRVRRASDLCITHFDPVAIKTADESALAFYDEVFPYTAAQRRAAAAEAEKDSEALQQRLKTRQQEKSQRKKAAKRSRDESAAHLSSSNGLEYHKEKVDTAEDRQQGSATKPAAAGGSPSFKSSQDMEESAAVTQHAAINYTPASEVVETQTQGMIRGLLVDDDD